jgi:hypothetical protein
MTNHQIPGMLVSGNTVYRSYIALVVSSDRKHIYGCQIKTRCGLLNCQIERSLASSFHYPTAVTGVTTVTDVTHHQSEKEI